MSRRVNFRLALTFALLLTACFPRFSWWFLSYVALIPLLTGLQQSKSFGEAFRFSYLAGFLFLMLSLFWVRHVTFAGLTVLCVLHAFAFGLFGVLAKNLLGSCGRVAGASRPGLDNSRRRGIFPRTTEPGRDAPATGWPIVLVTLVMPALWVGLEFIRLKMPVIGFGFNLLGHSQIPVAVVAQSASIFGELGLSYFVALVNVIVFLFLQKKKTETIALSSRESVLLGTVLFIFVAGVVAFGNVSLSAQPKGEPLRISVIQGNIPQDSKWDETVKPLVIEKYKKLSQIAQYDGPELMIWPEAAWPGYFTNDYESAGFQSFIDELQVPMVIGSPHGENAEVVLNSAFLVEPARGIVDRYDKVNLVPFGEYVPFGQFFRLFGIEQYAQAMGVSDFAFGKDPEKLFKISTPGETVIASGATRSRGVPPRNILAGQDARPTVSGHRFATVICFEDGFADFCRRLVNKGAEFLVVITNDAWFKNSAGPYQHLSCSIMRAIENGVYVVRAANTGVSGFIDPKGFVVDRVEDAQGHDILIAGGLTRPIFTSSNETIYKKFGFLFPYLCLLVSMAAIPLKFPS